MVPRTDIVGVRSDASVEDALQVALGAGHRRLIVHGETLDEIHGIVKLRDLVAVPAERRDLAVRHMASEPLVVPESKRLFDLLREMQDKGTHLALVVDEYGGTAGLVTVEDIAEELLGSIEEDQADAELIRIDAGRWALAGLLPVEDLEEALGVALPDGDWNTAAGLVVGLLGRLPRVGDEVAVAGHRLRVTAMRRRRIHRLEVAADDG